MANKPSKRFKHGKNSNPAIPVELDAWSGTIADHHERVADAYLAPHDKLANANLSNAIYAYVLTGPGMTHNDFQNLLVDYGLHRNLSVVDASDLDIKVQRALMYLEGKIDKIYAIEFNLLDPATNVDDRQRLYATIPSKYLAGAGYITPHDQPPISAGAYVQPLSPMADDKAFTGSLVEDGPVTAGWVNAQPPLSTIIPDESAISLGAEFDQSRASLEIPVLSPTAPRPANIPAQTMAPTHVLAESNNAAFSEFPASFKTTAYSSVVVNATPKPVMQEGGGLVLPAIISSDSELWKNAKAAIMQRLRFETAGDGARGGMRCKLDPELEAWVGKDIMKRVRSCTNHVFKAANPPSTLRRLDAQQITALMGLMPHEGGFDAAVSRRIEESLNHMIKHMLWAFDFVQMQKNNYQHFVPADRYRLARMLGLMPNGRAHLEFDIVSRRGPNKGQKIGVWKGVLDQLSRIKGDQSLLPDRM